jgi:hypothetical protein
VGVSAQQLRDEPERAAEPAPAPVLAPAPAEVPAGAYVARRTVYRLEPDPATDPDLAAAGLWIRVRSASLGQLLDYGFGPRLTTAPDSIFREFCSALEEWNVHDEAGDPVEPTFEGLRTLDDRLAIRLVRMWQNVLTGVSDPFADASNGGPPPEPPMPLPMTPTAP